MSTRSIVTAILLIGLGIIFGVVLVSSYKGVDLTFAGGPVQLGSDNPSPRTSAALQSQNESNAAIARELIPTVVYIEVTTTKKSSEQPQSNPFFHFFGPEFRFDMPRQLPERGAGSGVILTPDGHILTNNHVVQGADAGGIEVTLWDNRKFKNAKVLGNDPLTDLAIVKIDAKDLPVPRLGNSDELEVGYVVYAFGNPLGLMSTMTQGIVSALGRGQLNIIRESSGYGIENFIQTDAAVNPGNSGGALVNTKGEVVGINTAIATTNQRFQGYSFAIPINIAKKVASDLVAHGKVRRGYIGVRIQSVDATVAKAVGLDTPKGAFVVSVNPGSGGEEAGVQSGDVILSVDGRDVNSSNELQGIIGNKAPGETVVLKVFRNKKTLEIRVKLKPRDDEEEALVAAGDARRGEEMKKETGAQTAKVESIGLTVKNLDDKLKKEYNVDSGVIVESVEPGSEAAARGIVPRDVILSVGDRQIANAGQFAEFMKTMKTGDAVLLRAKGTDKRTKYVAVEIPKR